MEYQGLCSGIKKKKKQEKNFNRLSAEFAQRMVKIKTKLHVYAIKQMKPNFIDKKKQTNIILVWFYNVTATYKYFGNFLMVKSE